MTKREIMDLVQHNQETKTYYVHYEDYGFHSTSLDTVVEQLKTILCQMPGCGHARCGKDGRLAYLCPNHFAEACREDETH
jgi:hypothetical protein